MEATRQGHYFMLEELLGNKKSHVSINYFVLKVINRCIEICNYQVIISRNSRNNF